MAEPEHIGAILKRVLRDIMPKHPAGPDKKDRSHNVTDLLPCVARRIGELVPPQPAGEINPKRRSSEKRTIEIPKQRLTEFRKVAASR